MKALGHILRDTYLPDPADMPSVQEARVNQKDKASDWVITDEMLVVPLDNEVTETIKASTENKSSNSIKKPKNKGRRKLTETAVRSIREHAATGMAKGELAKIHNVTPTCIWNIVQCNTWKHVQ